jgi:DNA polymerase-3 subunit delta
MGRALQRYKKLFDQVKREPPRRLYFLYGPEEFLKREFVAELVKTCLPERNRAFNLDIFHGDDFDRDAFSDRVSSFPLFTDRRMVILKKFETLSVSNQDFVLERLTGSADPVVLIVEASSAKLETARLKKLDELAQSRGLSFCFQHLSDEEAVERAGSRLQREGHRIEPDALELLVNSAGTQLIDLANEIEKIVLSAEPGSTITRDTVAAVVGKYRAENLFKFLDRLGRDEPAETLAKLNRIIDGGEEPVFVLSMLIRRVVQLLQVRLLMDEGVTGSRPLAQKLQGSASPYQAAILAEQARVFTARDLELYLKNLRWADRMIKSSNMEPAYLIEVVLVASSERKTLARAAAWV